MYHDYTTYWDREGSTKIQKVMEDAGMTEDQISIVISEMDEIVSEIRWEAKNDGASEESYNQSMSYMG